MKCKVFWGCMKEALDAFNKWAKGKQLNREVIIHEHIFSSMPTSGSPLLFIFVYHPEGKEWDTTEQQTTPEKMVNQHIAGHQSAMEIPA